MFPYDLGTYPSQLCEHMVAVSREHSAQKYVVKCHYLISPHYQDHKNTHLFLLCGYQNNYINALLCSFLLIKTLIHIFKKFVYTRDH